MRINWNKLEAVLLIKGYVVWQENHLKLNDIVHFLSNKLREKAIENKIKIDDRYRNYTGIEMKLRNIQYLFTNGLYGLANYSRLELEIYELYVNNQNEFEKLLNEAYQEFSMKNFEDYFSN